eukprot:Opistho-2@64566
MSLSLESPPVGGNAKGRTADDKLLRPTFVRKLLGMLESEPQLLSWNENGDGFVIDDKQQLSKVLSKYFKSGVYSSFVRQLNSHGFRKVAGDKDEFVNPLFLRHTPEATLHIVRGSGVAASTVSDDEAALSDGSRPLSPKTIAGVDIRRELQETVIDRMDALEQHILDMQKIMDNMKKQMSENELRMSEYAALFKDKSRAPALLRLMLPNQPDARTSTQDPPPLPRDHQDSTRLLNAKNANAMSLPVHLLTGLCDGGPVTFSIVDRGQSGQGSGDRGVTTAGAPSSNNADSLPVAGTGEDGPFEILRSEIGGIKRRLGEVVDGDADDFCDDAHKRQRQSPTDGIDGTGSCNQ